MYVSISSHLPFLKLLVYSTVEVGKPIAFLTFFFQRGLAVSVKRQPQDLTNPKNPFVTHNSNSTVALKCFFFFFFLLIVSRPQVSQLPLLFTAFHFKIENFEFFALWVFEVFSFSPSFLSICVLSFISQLHFSLSFPESERENLTIKW